MDFGNLTCCGRVGYEVSDTADESLHGCDDHVFEEAMVRSSDVGFCRSVKPLRCGQWAGSGRYLEGREPER